MVAAQPVEPVATITDTGILGVNGSTTVNGAPTLSVTVAIGGAAQRRVTLFRTAPAPKVIIAGDNRTIGDSRVEATAEATVEATAEATSEATVGATEQPTRPRAQVVKIVSP